MYPIARGTAPLLAVAIGVFVLGERLGVAGSIGVVALLAGLLHPPAAVAGPARSRGADPAVAFALATGVTIATYSAIDRVGTRLIDPLPYAAILWVTATIALIGWIRLVVRDRTGLLSGEPAAVRSAAVGGWLTLGAYLLILVALSRGPAVRGGAAAGVGDRVRRGLGLRPARRGGDTGRRGPSGRGVRPDRRRRRCSSPSPADRRPTRSGRFDRRAPGRTGGGDPSDR